MRIYRKNKQELVKVSITKQQCQSESITIADANIEDVMALIKKNIHEVALAIPSGFRTSIVVREYIDGKFGKNISTSIYGSDPVDVKEFLEDKISSLKKVPLPDFLYESDGRIFIGVNGSGDPDVTDDWNRFVNKHI